MLIQGAFDVTDPCAQAVVHRPIECVVEVEGEQPARRHHDERGADAREGDQPHPQRAERRRERHGVSL